MNERISHYQVRIQRLAENEGGGYVAYYDELSQSVTGLGSTQAEALAELEANAEAYLTDLPDSDFPEPRKQAEWSDYSGRVTLRLPKMLHAQLQECSEEQGVSLNSFLTTCLQAAATATLAGDHFGSCGKRSRWDDRPAARKVDGWREASFLTLLERGPEKRASSG